MNFIFDNPYPAGSLSIAELQSNPHVIKYMIKEPTQGNTPASDGTTAPLTVNPVPVAKSNAKWVIPALIIGFAAGLLIIGYINSTINKDYHESQKI